MLIGCDISEPQDANTYAISEMYSDIEGEFLRYDLGDIYNRYSTEFQHNGETIFIEENWWRNQWANYPEIHFENIQINRIGDYYAEVSFLVNFSGDNEFSYQEPDTYGNISHLKKENGIWHIYGNQNK
jgi:hypothetical protein